MLKYLKPDVIEILYQNRKLLGISLVDPERFRNYKSYMKKNYPKEFAEFEDLNLRLQSVLKSSGANFIYLSQLNQFTEYEGNSPTENGFIKLLDSPEIAPFFNENIEKILTALKKLQIITKEVKLNQIPEGLKTLNHHLEVQEHERNAQVNQISEMEQKLKNFLGINPKEQHQNRISMVNSITFIDPLKKLENTIKNFKNNSVTAYVHFGEIEKITHASIFDDRGRINFPETEENMLFLSFKKMKEFAERIETRMKKIKPTSGQRFLYTITNPIAKLLKKINIGEGKGINYDKINEYDYLEGNLIKVSEQLNYLEESEYYQYLQLTEDMISANIRLKKIDNVINGIKLDIEQGNKMLSELKKSQKEEIKSETEGDREGTEDREGRSNKNEPGIK